MIESCGDAPAVYENTDAPNSFDCLFPDGPKFHIVSVEVDDGQASANTGSDSINVTVGNVKPRVTLEGPATVGESTTAERTYTFTVADPGDDTFEVEQGFPSCGQKGTLVGSSLATNAGGGSFKCLFPDGDATSNVAIKVKDSDGASDTDGKVVTVTVENGAPTAMFDAPDSVDEGEAIKLSLMGASDPAGTNDTIEYAFDCGSGYGAFGPESSFTCPPTGDGEVSVGGKVRDEDGGENEYTDTVTVENVAPVRKENPSGQQSSYKTRQDETLIVEAEKGVLKDYSDPGRDPIFAGLVTPTVNGSLTLNEDGFFTYELRKGFNGTDSFTYEVCDDAGACAAPEKATIEVSRVDDPSNPAPPVNGAPTALNDAYSVKQGSRLSVGAPGVLKNDRDPNGDPLSAPVVSGTKRGKLVLKPNGSFVHTPAKSFSGADYFTYRASDGKGGTSDARVKITVRPASAPPPAPTTPRCTIVGTPGNDVLRGTSGSDAICGGGGNDTIYGLAGADALIGGPGNDKLYGGPDNDTVIGGPGDDVVVGGPGKDVETR